MERQRSVDVRMSGDGHVDAHHSASCAAQQALHQQTAEQQHGLRWVEMHATRPSTSRSDVEAASAHARDVPDLNLSPPDEAAHGAAACERRSHAAADCGDAESQTLLHRLAGAAVRLAAEQSVN